MATRSNPSKKTVSTKDSPRKTDSQYLLILGGIVLVILIVFIAISASVYWFFIKDDLNNFLNDQPSFVIDNSDGKPVENKQSEPSQADKNNSNSQENILESTGSTVVKTESNTQIVYGAPPKIDTKPKTTKVIVSTNTKTTSYKTKTNTNTNTSSPKCYEYKLGDPFNVTKCYSYDDYVDLLGAYNSYRGVNTRIKFIKNAIDMTCDGSEFFKDSCERNKNDLDEAENQKNKYESKILSIIPKGK